MLNDLAAGSPSFLGLSYLLKMYLLGLFLEKGKLGWRGWEASKVHRGAESGEVE